MLTPSCLPFHLLGNLNFLRMSRINIIFIVFIIYFYSLMYFSSFLCSCIYAFFLYLFFYINFNIILAFVYFFASLCKLSSCNSMLPLLMFYLLFSIDINHLFHMTVIWYRHTLMENRFLVINHVSLSTHLPSRLSHLHAFLQKETSNFFLIYSYFRWGKGGTLPLKPIPR